MRFTVDKLVEIQGLGEIHFSVEECAQVMDCEPSDISENRDAMRAYNRGRLMASAAVRQAILQQAKNGSSPAQRQMLQIMKGEKNSKSDLDLPDLDL